MGTPSPSAAPLAVASALLILSIVLALVLIPVIDAELRRTTARRVANDNARAEAPKPERQVG